VSKAAQTTNTATHPIPPLAGTAGSGASAVRVGSYILFKLE
jgi:hypothetical protein